MLQHACGVNRVCSGNRRCCGGGRLIGRLASGGRVPELRRRPHHRRGCRVPHRGCGSRVRHSRGGSPLHGNSGRHARRTRRRKHPSRDVRRRVLRHASRCRGKLQRGSGGGTRCKVDLLRQTVARPEAVHALKVQAILLQVARDILACHTLDIHQLQNGFRHGILHAEVIHRIHESRMQLRRPHKPRLLAETNAGACLRLLIPRQCLLWYHILLRPVGVFVMSCWTLLLLCRCSTCCHVAPFVDHLTLRVAFSAWVLTGFCSRLMRWCCAVISSRSLALATSFVRGRRWSGLCAVTSTLLSRFSTTRCCRSRTCLWRRAGARTLRRRGGTCCERSRCCCCCCCWCWCCCCCWCCRRRRCGQHPRRRLFHRLHPTRPCLFLGRHVPDVRDGVRRHVLDSRTLLCALRRAFQG
mmetsp:Transcript_10673/g.24159  ORF Transcript_10673/g.24159 Transcript_10673/m.24159 type:complete len:411 (+) Transcript_10673:248-1480(+)